MADDQGDWKQYQQKFVGGMVVTQLQGATAKRDLELLNKAIEDAEKVPEHAEMDEYKKAIKAREILQEKQELEKIAKEATHPQQIHDNIKTIQDRGHEKQLKTAIRQAKKAADILERKLKKNETLPPLNKKTIGEVHRYTKPPAMVKSVIRGFLLLFNVDEETSQEWSLALKHLNPNGPQGLERRLHKYDLSKANGELAARAKAILSEIHLNELVPVSPHAASFLVWSMGTIEELEGQGITGEPADIDRQKRILYGEPKKLPTFRNKYRPVKRKDKSNASTGMTSTDHGSTPNGGDEGEMTKVDV